MVIKDLEYLLDPESWPEFMRSALLPAPSRRAWTDADWAANEARINTLNAGIPGGLRGALLPKMPWPTRPPFMQRPSMPTPQEQEPDRLVVRDPRATGFPLREGASRDDVLSNLARLGAHITPQHPAYGANMLAPNLASMLRGERNPAEVAYERTPLPKYPGKVPQMSAPDPRLPGAILEAGQLGSSFVPFGWAAQAPVVAERVLPMAERALPTSRAAVSSGAYNPPQVPRPFTRDYRPGDFPHGVPHDATGTLTQTPEGAPIVAQNVVGRIKFGQPDVPLPVSKQEPIIQAITGQPTQYRPAAQMGNDLGRTITFNGRPVEVALRDDLLPGHREIVQAHELGHVIEDAVRTIPTRGLEHELKPVYNTLNNPKRTRNGLDADPRAPLFIPQYRGYSDAAAPREYMSEAIRAYMASPSWFKTVAPETAKRAPCRRNRMASRRRMRRSRVCWPLGRRSTMILHRWASTCEADPVEVSRCNRTTRLRDRGTMLRAPRPLGRTLSVWSHRECGHTIAGGMNIIWRCASFPGAGSSLGGRN